MHASVKEAGSAVWSRYLALGDSVTQGVGDDVDGIPCRSWADWLVDGLKVAMPGFEYRNVAVGGATASNVRASQIQEIERFTPDLVSVTVGANDARVPDWTSDGFESEYSTILESITRTGASALIATYADVEDVIKQAGGTIRDSWRLYFERMHEVNGVIRTVGTEYGAFLIDVERAEEVRDTRYLSRDFTHPNALAYRWLGQLALEALTAGRRPTT